MDAAQAAGGARAHLEERADVEQRAVAAERDDQVDALRERLACNAHTQRAQHTVCTLLFVQNS